MSRYDPHVSSFYLTLIFFVQLFPFSSLDLFPHGPKSSARECVRTTLTVQVSRGYKDESWLWNTFRKESSRHHPHLDSKRIIYASRQCRSEVLVVLLCGSVEVCKKVSSSTHMAAAFTSNACCMVQWFFRFQRTKSTPRFT